VADLPHQCLSAGLLVPIQDWAFLSRCSILDRPNMSDSPGSRASLHNAPSLDCSQSRSCNSLIKSILVLLANPFHNSHSVNFFQLESAHSSSCCAASLGWENGLVHYCTITTTEMSSMSRGNTALSKLHVLTLRDSLHCSTLRVQGVTSLQNLALRLNSHGHTLRKNQVPMVHK
jgi:hypothetical protein